MYATRASNAILEDNVSMMDSDEDLLDGRRARARGEPGKDTQIDGQKLLKSLRVPMEGTLVYNTSKRRIPTKHRHFSRSTMKQAADIPAKLIPIALDVDVEGIHIRDEFVWNANEKLITPEDFATVLVQDLLVAGDILSKLDIPEKETAQTAEQFLRSALRSAAATTIPDHVQSLLVRHIESAIVSQVAQANAAYGEDEDAQPMVEHLPEDFVELHVLQDGYIKIKDAVEEWQRVLETMEPILEPAYAQKLKTLLRNHSSLAEELKVKAEVLSLVDPPEIVYNPGVDEEVRVIVKLDISVGPLKLVDKFEYPLYSNHPPLIETQVGQTPIVTPETFAAKLCSELGIGSSFVPSIAFNIRSQILQARLSAFTQVPDGIEAEHHHVILQQPILSALRMDPAPNPNTGLVEDFWEPHLVELTAEDVEKLRREAERGQRRMRRETRIRAGR